MITRIETLNYRCLKYVDQQLSRFQVLVGANASGKTTFLDVIDFLGDLISDGLETAIFKRSRNFQDLIWNRGGNSFELAVEALIPDTKKETLGEKNKDYNIIRYEVTIGKDETSEEIIIYSERVLFKKTSKSINSQKKLFPSLMLPPETILTDKNKSDTKAVISKIRGGNDNFYSETGKGYQPSFKLGPKKSAFGNLFDDEDNYPVAIWFRNLLIKGVQKLVLNSLTIRNPSPPLFTKKFQPDGSNLPWVIHRLSTEHPDLFKDWLSHVQTSLSDIDSIYTIERPEDKHRYLGICYKSGLQVPSWMVSDGTLRLLALTIIAYLPDGDDLYLIEEPENGIHPLAIETIFQSLKSIYNGQTLIATHSPVIISLSDIQDILCFAKTSEGATDIVRGDEHPNLKEWHQEINLGLLFASGVLG